MKASGWQALEREVVACGRCPRLLEHCRETARVKRRMYRDETYWGKPVPGFGDRRASVLFVGLAPGAHGANRTGRLFTGDRSGEWLYGGLHRFGWASAPQSVSRDDGLRLRDAFITNVCRCAPPGNRPARDEIAACRPYLDREFEGLDRLRVVVALGSIAWEAVLVRAKALDPEAFPSPKPKFGHAAEVALKLRPGRRTQLLLGCYHPSQQNTQTGRLTRTMFDRVLRRAQTAAGSA